MDENLATLIQCLLYKLACTGQVNEDVLVLRIIDRYCQVVGAGGRIFRANRNGVSYTIFLPVFNRTCCRKARQEFVSHNTSVFNVTVIPKVSVHFPRKICPLRISVRLGRPKVIERVGNGRNGIQARWWEERSVNGRPAWVLIRSVRLEIGPGMITEMSRLAIKPAA